MPLETYHLIMLCVDTGYQWITIKNSPLARKNNYTVSGLLKKKEWFGLLTVEKRFYFKSLKRGILVFKRQQKKKQSWQWHWTLDQKDNWPMRASKIASPKKSKEKKRQRWKSTLMVSLWAFSWRCTQICKWRCFCIVDGKKWSRLNNNNDLFNSVFRILCMFDRAQTTGSDVFIGRYE